MKMSDTSTKSRRRWFQFSLRTLLILVTLAVGLLFGWRMYTEPFRRQHETMALVERLGGRYETEAAETRLRWAYGTTQSLVLVDVADCNDPNEYIVPIARLPCLEILVVGGRRFGDEHLVYLKELDTLRGLILDSTSVTDGNITSLKRALPNVVVYRSQRRSIAAIQRLCKSQRPWVDAILGMREDVHVELDNVPFQFRRPDLKKYFQNLIYFRDTEVSDAGLALFKDLTTLESLNLRDQQVSDTGLAHLKGLTKLKILDLAGTQVSDAGLAHLKGLANLIILRLKGTRVSDAGLAHLKGLTKLERLPSKAVSFPANCA